MLLLIFLVRCRLAGGWRSVLVRLNFAGMTVGAGMCCVVVYRAGLIRSSGVLGSFVGSRRFLGRFGVALKLFGLGRGGDRRLALIGGGA